MDLSPNTVRARRKERGRDHGNPESLATKPKLIALCLSWNAMVENVHDLEAVQRVNRSETWEAELWARKGNAYVHDALAEQDVVSGAVADSIRSLHWRTRAEKDGPVGGGMAESSKWEDIFLLCPEGSIVYAVLENDNPPGAAVDHSGSLRHREDSGWNAISVRRNR